MEAYCFKCKTKREIQNPVAEFNQASAPVTRGICGVCGTQLYRIGRTEAHDGLPVPERKPRIRKQQPSVKTTTSRAKTAAKAKTTSASKVVRTAKSGKSTKSNGKQSVVRRGKLVIVESPAKARTVGRFLGRGYTVKASVGHVRDLLRSELAVDVKNDFKPKYRVPNERRQVVKEIKELARNAAEVYLATDPDREGEAIAWHLLEAAEIEPELTRRVVFHEITEPAIQEAFSHPRAIDMSLVDAQQARRVLDRLVGYSLSPLLWEKVRRRLSAGRVQSVALRLVVEREREIEKFQAVEYWTISAELKPEKVKQSYVARLVKLNGRDPDLNKRDDVTVLLPDMEEAAYTISKIKRGERKRKPSAPFTTSTLQQEASRRLGFTARKTMTVAQQLYEGLDVGEGGTTGMITYMRTDSTNVSDVAQKEARAWVQQTYGQDFLPPTPPQYRTRTAGAQEAHEAIRPTSVRRLPDQMKKSLSNDQFRLYQLIWKRFLASQMEAAVYDTVAVDVTAAGKQHEYLLRASGATVRFPGFMILYEEARDEDKHLEEDDDVRIPAGLEEGQRQNLERLLPEQHFTQPPPRFTEASLVQTLEEFGIGRPSTYAPILSTIQERGYVLREAKRLMPTETGELVNDLLVDHFPEIVDTGFTSQMEDDLDEIANGERRWNDVVSDFYVTFAPQLEKAQALMPVTKAELEKLGRSCPQCGHDLVVRVGRYGKFISCSNFPTCRYTEPWLERIGVRCPEDGGEIVQRKTRKGRTFYGCSNYPQCQFTSWKRPLATPCPACGGLLVAASKRDAECTQCKNTFLLEQINESTPETV